MSNISLGQLPGEATTPAAPSTFHTHVVSHSSLFKTTPFLHDYDLVKKLNSGSHGVVWSAVKKGTSQQVAVKMMKKSNTHNTADNIGREIGFLAELKHPHILEFIDAYEDNHNFYVVTELCTGGDLFDAIDGSNNLMMSEDDTKKVTKQILEALAYCHGKGIVHSDIKPENIMLVEPWQKPNRIPDIKVIDFGLAQHLPQHGYLTKLQGTLDFAAPEVFQEQYHEKADLWSVGVCIFAMLLGSFPPFGNGNVASRLRHQYEAVRKGKLFYQVGDAAISDLAKDLIEQLLTWRSSERPSAAQALQHPWLTGKAKPITPLEITARIRHFIESQRLIRVIKMVIQHNLTAPERMRIEALFRHFAGESRDKISFPDMAQILREKIGIQNDDEIKVILNLMDLNSDGFIDVHEFLFSLFPVQ